MKMGEPWERDSNRYWAREAAKAYEERRLAVSDRLAENGGREELWMRYQINDADLRALLARP
jgi:hypothetical protein